MEISEINPFFRPILRLSNGNGDGYGHGNGDGYGHGYGDGDGYGYGDGDGYGHGDGDGYGYGHGNGYGHGYGHGILFLNKNKIYIIDNLQTIIHSIKNDVAKGFILNKDLTLDSCFIVRNGYHYSHGKTLKKALKSLEEKTLLLLPIPKRIENFKSTFKDYSVKIKAMLLYDWHFRLTGSCKMGRDNFIQNHNINLSKDKLTVLEFIELTKNSYGGDIIKQLINKTK